MIHKGKHDYEGMSGESFVLMLKHKHDDMKAVYGIIMLMRRQCTA